jgi:hypothetical protein
VKSFLTIALGLIMMVYAVSTSLLVLNYRVNMNFIIENFCENTDKPEIHCDGKCHLNKQIQQEENQKSENPISVNEGISFVFTIEELPTLCLDQMEQSDSRTSSPYLVKSYGSHQLGVFHPPQI